VSRLIFRYLAQALFVLSPFIAPIALQQPRLRALVVQLFGTATPPPEQTRAAISFVFLATVFVYDALDLYIPRESRRRFRNRYLKARFAELQENLHTDVRINVMFVRRRWFLAFIPYFEWTANHGFKAGRDRDNKLGFFIWQGVCGKAYRSGLVTWEDLRGSRNDWTRMNWGEKFLFRNQYALAYWQLAKTRSVKGILSVPIFRQKGEHPNADWRAVGVINVDAITTEGADWLAANHPEWRDFFLDLGTTLAELD
jgi:hypothetical protein